MLFVPFAVFLLNNVFVHAELYDTVYTDKDKCVAAAEHAATAALTSLPDGGSITVACLPLPSKAIAPPEAPPKPTGAQKQLGQGSL